LWKCINSSGANQFRSMFECSNESHFVFGEVFLKDFFKKVHRTSLILFESDWEKYTMVHISKSVRVGRGHCPFLKLSHHAMVQKQLESVFDFIFLNFFNFSRFSSTQIGNNALFGMTQKLNSSSILQTFSDPAK
jgi:hypothetical protein